MENAIVSEEAVLWHGGEALAEGPLSDCIKNWLGLPRGPRANSYIQLRKPMGQKSVFRPNELYRIAAGPGPAVGLYERRVPIWAVRYRDARNF